MSGMSLVHKVMIHAVSKTVIRVVSKVGVGRQQDVRHVRSKQPQAEWRPLVLARFSQQMSAAGGAASKESPLVWVVACI